MIDRRTLIRNGSAATVGALATSALASTTAAAAATGHETHAHPHQPAHHADAIGAADPTGPTSGVTRTVLQRHPSPAKGWETVQTLVEIPRGKESGRHSHPGVEVGYIVRGDVLMVFDDGHVLRLRTGDPFFIPSEAIHNARNVGTVTTMMLSTYVVDETKPLVTTYECVPAKSRP
ncbi:cupin domain-containing protein [Streptomyces sp. NPDC051162]|uniref:cupin domain-containing protein n=1 Tax=unclassified Streptomyces TaxID=2593676 RepID=UPI00342411F8